jgi:hypothetical protein
MAVTPVENPNDHCGEQLKGRDGKLWTSAMGKDGNCRWSRRPQTPAEAARHGMWVFGPGPARSNTRWLAADIETPAYLLRKHYKNQKSYFKKPDAADKRKPVAKRNRSKSKNKATSKAKSVTKRGRSISPCPKDQKIITRKAYTRADGTRVKATTYCRKK